MGMEMLPRAFIVASTFLLRHLIQHIRELSPKLTFLRNIDAVSSFTPPSLIPLKCSYSSHEFLTTKFSSPMI